MKEKELVIIPIVNMSYLLKGAKADFDYFFPELPEKPMTRKQMQKFAQGIKKSVRPDGKSYEKCISINEKRRKI